MYMLLIQCFICAVFLFTGRYVNYMFNNKTAIRKMTAPPTPPLENLNVLLDECPIKKDSFQRTSKQLLAFTILVI